MGNIEIYMIARPSCPNSRSKVAYYNARTPRTNLGCSRCAYPAEAGRKAVVRVGGGLVCKLLALIVIDGEQTVAGSHSRDPLAIYVPLALPQQILFNSRSSDLLSSMYIPGRKKPSESVRDQQAQRK